MSKKNRTTKEHFMIFQEEARYWIERFGLKNWRISFRHEHQEQEAFASYGYNIHGHTIILNLEPDWEDIEVTEAQLRRSAFHEVRHIILCRLRALAMARQITEGDIDEEIHNIIRIDENAVWEPERGDKQ